MSDLVIDDLRSILGSITNNNYVDFDTDISLFSDKYLLNSRDVVYFLIGIEEKFGVIFEEDKINDFGFFTLGNIAKELSCKIEI